MSDDEFRLKEMESALDQGLGLAVLGEKGCFEAWFYLMDLRMWAQ